jgi:short-subunit dehydrogenase
MAAYSTAIVTGASRGLGRAVVDGFRGRGLDVVGIARPDAEVLADIRRPEQIARAIDEARERLGHVDVLVNNAGTGVYKPFLEHTDEEIATIVELNVTSLMLCTRAVLPEMLHRGSGLIVNVGSDLSRRYLPNMAPYTASKWAVLGFSGSLLREVKESGVKVCTVMPGAIATGFGGGEEREAPEDGSQLSAGDVAAAVVALLDQPDRAVVDEVIVHPLRQDDY